LALVTTSRESFADSLWSRIGGRVGSTARAIGAMEGKSNSMALSSAHTLPIFMNRFIFTLSFQKKESYIIDVPDKSPLS
jgi:hypothetical protein